MSARTAQSATSRQYQSRTAHRRLHHLSQIPRMFRVEPIQRQGVNAAATTLKKNLWFCFSLSTQFSGINMPSKFPDSGGPIRDVGGETI